MGAKTAFKRLEVKVESGVLCMEENSPEVSPDRKGRAGEARNGDRRRYLVLSPSSFHQCPPLKLCDTHTSYVTHIDLRIN